MKDSLYSENSFIIDRSWEKVNPQHQLKVTIQQTHLFISLLIQQHKKLGSINRNPSQEMDKNALDSKIHSFILKYIQQKQLGSLKKGQIPFVKQSAYKFDLGDCLQIWRWINEDITSSSHLSQNEEYPDTNQFALPRSFTQPQLITSKISTKSSIPFDDFSLEQQEAILKKSLQMVYMYKNQLKIIFKHYSRFARQNQHKRTDTFDDVAPLLQVMTLNRFMLFCRDFDIIKIVEFKRKTEHNKEVSKKTLLDIFKKTSHLQKYMNFEGFMLSLVNISIKIHQNIDPRSLMHTELLLNALHIKYHNEFSAKLDSLMIKYTPDDFYHCYKDILKKANKKREQQEKITLFNNPHFINSEAASSRYKESLTFEHRAEEAYEHQQLGAKTYNSVSHLDKIGSIVKVKGKNNQKRKTSLPVLPAINQNKYFKPIEHNHHKNNYQQYLKSAEQTTSVFKNRITGYTNINTLKQKKPFHMTDNPETVSKNTLEELITDTKTKLQTHKPAPYHNNVRHQPTSISEVNQSLVYSNVTANEQLISQNNSINLRLNDRSQTSKQGDEVQDRQGILLQKNLLEREQKQKKKVIKELSEKVDLKDNDSLLKKHFSNQAERSKSEMVLSTTQT